MSEAVATPEVPWISWDSWGLIFIGTFTLVLWLAFRRMFPEEKKPPQKPLDRPGDKTPGP